MSKTKASVTVFLSLLLVLLLSIVTLSIESAHVAAVRSNISMVCHGVTDELLSRYEARLFSEYKLFALNDRLDFQDVLEKDMGAYNKNGLFTMEYQSFLNFSYQKIRVGNMTYLTDNDCEAFQEQLAEIIASDAMDIAMSMLGDYLMQLSQGARLAELMNEIMSESSAITKMTGSLKAISDRLSALNEKKTEMEGKLSDLTAKLSKVNEKTDELMLEDTVKDTKETVSSISKLKNDLLKDYREILISLSEAISSMGEIAGNLKDILSKADLTGEGMDRVKNAIKSLTNLVSESGSLYQAVKVAIDKLKSNSDILEKIELPSVSDITKEAVLEGKIGIKISSVKDGLGKILDASIQNLQISEAGEEDSGLASLLENVKQLLGGDFLALVLPEGTDISDQEILMEEYPSDKSTGFLEIFDSKIFENPGEASMEELCLDVYLQQYFDCYTDGSEYELEYILSNQRNERECLSSVIKQLVLMRQISNMITILMDDDMMDCVKTATEAIPAVGTAIMVVVIAAWAFAESICDVRALTGGGKIPLIKKPSQMKLSLEGAKNVDSWKKGTESISDSTGLNYKQYLFILSFFHLQAIKRYRALDIIQWKLEKEDPGFLISQCVYSLDADFSLTAKAVFPVGGNDRWTFSHMEMASYGSEDKT